MRGRGVSFVICGLVLAALLLAHGEASAQDSGVDPAQELADRFAPDLMLVAQDDECDGDGERFAPMAVDAVLDNPQVLLRQVSRGDPVITRGAGGADLFGLGEGFYLDYPGDALAPGCIYERDFRRFTDGQNAVVYAHVVTTDDHPDRLALQYWFFWYYNDWNNKHEGDWEGIQLLFDAATVDEAIAGEPISVGYAQHEGGERAEWNDPKLQRRGDHPVVFSSAGSHASYFSDALHLGRGASEGFGCDTTVGPSREVRPDVVVLPDAVDDPDDPLAWLAYEGRWGERQDGPFNGPTGPSRKGRWTEPFAWHDELRSASVVVPGGDGGAGGLIDTFCGVVEWGSAQLITIQENPLQLVAAVAALLAIVVVLLRRTDWSAVPTLPISRRRRAGQIIKAAGRLYRDRPLPFLQIGLLYVPLAFAVGIVVSLLRLVPVVDALVATDQDVGLVGAFMTLVVGGLGHGLAFVVVTAAVAVLLRSLEDGGEISGASAFRLVLDRIGDLAAGIGRVFLFVGLLSASVVGLPWALRQLVRYQFVAQATVLEEQRGQAALDRSSELVEGRWWHTAGVLALVNALVAVAAGAVGLVLLLVLAGLPLWVFSLLVTASSVLIVPFSAIVAVLLHGDATAEDAALVPAG